MSCSYNNSMYTLDIPDEDVDTSLCETCPYADGICWKAGYCIVEDMN